jgi:hypothetical protein
MKYFTIFSFYLLISLQGNAQSTQIHSTDILSACLRDTQIGASEQLMLWQKNAKNNLPFIERIDLRTQTERFRLAEQSYLGRVNVNGIMQQKAQKRLNLQQYALMQSERNFLLHSILVNRYEQLVDWADNKETAILRKLQIPVLEDKIMVMRRKAAQTTEFDLEKILEAEYQLDMIRLQILDDETESNVYKQLIMSNLLVDKTLQLTDEDWLSPQIMAEKVINFDDNNNGTLHPLIAKSQVQLAYNVAEQKLESAKNRKVLDYVQLQYADKQKDLFPNDFSVGLGFSMPFRGSNRLKKTELTLQAGQYKQEILQNQDEINTKLMEQKVQMQALLQQLALLETQINNDKSQTIAQRLINAAAADPLVLLQIKEIQLRRTSKIAEINRAIRAIYVEWLDWSGAASAQPLIDGLSGKSL